MSFSIRKGYLTNYSHVQTTCLSVAGLLWWENILELHVFSYLHDCSSLFICDDNFFLLNFFLLELKPFVVLFLREEHKEKNILCSVENNFCKSIETAKINDFYFGKTGQILLNNMNGHLSTWTLIYQYQLKPNFTRFLFRNTVPSVSFTKSWT